MTLNMFILLCNHYLQPSPELFHYPEVKPPYPLNTNSLFSPPLSPWQSLFYFRSLEIILNPIFTLTLVGQSQIRRIHVINLWIFICNLLCCLEKFHRIIFMGVLVIFVVLLYYLKMYFRNYIFIHSSNDVLNFAYYVSCIVLEARTKQRKLLAFKECI